MAVRKKKWRERSGGGSSMLTARIKTELLEKISETADKKGMSRSRFLEEMIESYYAQGGDVEWEEG